MEARYYMSQKRKSASKDFSFFVHFTKLQTFYQIVCCTRLNSVFWKIEY